MLQAQALLYIYHRNSTWLWSTFIRRNFYNGLLIYTNFAHRFPYILNQQFEKLVRKFYLGLNRGAKKDRNTGVLQYGLHLTRPLGSELRLARPPGSGLHLARPLGCGLYLARPQGHGLRLV